MQTDKGAARLTYASQKLSTTSATVYYVFTYTALSDSSDIKRYRILDCNQNLIFDSGFETIEKYSDLENQLPQNYSVTDVTLQFVSFR